MKILIVEDEAKTGSYLQQGLREAGYAAEWVASGVDGLHEALHGDHDLLLLDVMLPDLSGWQILHELRQRGRDVPVLFLTARDEVEDRVKGLELGADDYLVKPFDQHELKVRLRAGRRIVELQSELVRAREALREQATKDFLTGIWNRSSILEILDRELQRSAREGSPVGVVLADLDHFKAVNDTFGHFAGDAVLREAARRMQSCCRGYDSIGRYGGEELLVILPGCQAECAEGQAERMRAVIESTPLTLGEDPYQLTCSFGVTWAEPGKAQPPEALIRTADDALYRAKRAGRNRVVAIETPVLA